MIESATFLDGRREASSGLVKRNRIYVQLDELSCHSAKYYERNFKEIQKMRNSPVKLNRKSRRGRQEEAASRAQRGGPMLDDREGLMHRHAANLRCLSYSQRPANGSSTARIAEVTGALLQPFLAKLERRMMDAIEDDVYVHGGDFFDRV